MSDAARRQKLPVIGPASLFCRWLPWVYCCSYVFLLTVSPADTYVMMTNSEVEPHRDGHIVSPNFPLSISRSNFSRMAKRVTLQLTVCRKCSISLHFRDSSLPYCHYPDRQLLAMQQTNLCAIGCSYFYLHEPYYKKTTRYIVRSAYYKTSSRSLLLVFCKGKYDTIRFNISYKIEDKTVTPNGQDNGTFMSLGYPGPYALNGDIYTYEIHSPGNYIRLTFDGWDLSYWTTIEIHYMHKNKSRSLIRRDFHPRPISQSYEHLTVVFSTGIDTSLFTKRPYLGFHARYEYVKEESWPEYPSVVCGEYFHLDKGGYFESPRCLPGQSVDCLWVIGPPHQLRVTRILINFQEQHMRRWTLKIRQGVTSWGPSVYNSQMFPKQSSSDALSPSGFYISLKYECQISASFNATFAYFDYPNYNNYCTNLGYQFHCKRQERCISEKLRCDGYNHCGDSSDENDCQGPTTLPRCRNGLLYHCPSNNRRICAEERCDGIKDCPLGSDERNCPATTSHPPREQSVGVSHWSTLVPIILICVIIVIVGCIAITWYIQCRHRRHPHEAHTPPGRVARHLRTISHQLGSTRWSGVDQNGLEHDAPPGYHEAVLYFPRAEAVNLGYTRTDSLEAFPKPPPYSPTLGLECIPPPSYEQINPRTLTDGFTSLQGLTGNHASPQVLTDNHASPHVLTDNHTSPHVLTDNHTSPHVLADNHTSPHVLTDNHASPHVLTDNHTSSHMLTDNHTSPHALTDNHASPHMLTDNHASPHMLTENHASPQVLTDNHASPHMLTENHTSPQVLTDNHASPHVLTDNNASPQVLTDNHASQQMLTDRSEGPLVLTDNYASFGRTTTLQFIENTDPDVEGLNATTV